MKVIIKISYNMRVYVSYIYKKVQWIYPVLYADLGLQLMPLQFKMAALIRVYRGSKKLLLWYIFHSLKVICV